jgi:hypothetical protein
MRLQEILAEIAEAFDGLQFSSQAYSQLPLNNSACEYCEFRDRCDRGHILASARSIACNIADIPEVVL